MDDPLRAVIRSHDEYRRALRRWYQEAHANATVILFVQSNIETVVNAICYPDADAASPEILLGRLSLFLHQEEDALEQRSILYPQRYAMIGDEQDQLVSLPRRRTDEEDQMSLSLFHESACLMETYFGYATEQYSDAKIAAVTGNDAASEFALRVRARLNAIAARWRTLHRFENESYADSVARFQQQTGDIVARQRELRDAFSEAAVQTLAAGRDSPFDRLFYARQAEENGDVYIVPFTVQTTDAEDVQNIVAPEPFQIDVCVDSFADVEVAHEERQPLPFVKFLEFDDD